MEAERSSPALAGPEPTADLNSLLRDVVRHLLDNAPHANFFQNAVSCVVVDDYRSHVPADQEMYLSKILERTEAQHYADPAAFRADLQLIYENAATYNGRNGGKHAYEPVIHWARAMLSVADTELRQRTEALRDVAEPQRPLCHEPEQPDAPMAEAAGDSTAAPAAPAAPAAEPPSLDGPTPRSTSPPPAEQRDGATQQQQPNPQLKPDPQQQQPDSQLSPVQEQQQPDSQPQQRISAAGGQGSPRVANGSAGQQSSSPSSGSGDAAHSGLEALLAACELAAEQDSAAPRSGPAEAAAPERRSYPGCGGLPANNALESQQQTAMAAAGEAAPDAVAAGPGPLSAPRQPLANGGQQQQHDEPVGSSEGGGMALCCVRGGGGAEGVVSTVQAAGAGGGGPGSGGGGPGAGGSYLASNAFKNRRHKSKVYIKPNKVVYLPTTFVEEEFNVTALPLECELRVEADGQQTDESFRVTIKSVPRQGLSTMYCMTNVMRFQQQYLNWQIYNWTRIDNNHIKIHLQSPSPSQTQLQRLDLDRSTSMPEVGRNLGSCLRGNEEGIGGGGGHQPRGNGNGVATSSSLKRKSDTGRYNFARVERRLVAEPGGRDLPVDLRLSSTGYLQYPSPIPESPPASPQRRVSTCIAAGAATTVAPPGAVAALPPRAPAPAQAQGGGGGLPHARLPQAPPHPHHLLPQSHQVHVHIHQHHPGSNYQLQHPQQQQRLQQLYQPHPHPHLLHHSSNGASNGAHPHYPQHNPLALPFPMHPQQQQSQQQLQHPQQQQPQRGSNSSIKADQQTCSEDSSGPAAGAADAASMPLAWHSAAGAGGGRPGGARSGGARGMPAAATLHPLDLTQQLHELAEQLQLQAHAAGGELPPLAALQLAMAALQQQQQQQLLAAAPPPPSLDLSNPADQERLLQHLGLGLGGVGLGGGVSLHSHSHPHPPPPHLQQQHPRGPRGSASSFLDLDMADLHAVTAAARRSGSGSGEAMGRDGDYDAAAAGVRGGGFVQRRPSNSGAVEAYAQLQLLPAPGAFHGEQQQQRRSSHGDRCRQTGAALALAPVGGGRNFNLLPDTAAAAQLQQQQQQRSGMVEGAQEDAAAGANPAAVAKSAADGEQREGSGAAADEMEELQHIVCHPRRSGNGGVNGHGAGKLFPGGGRILLDVGQLGGAAAGAGSCGSGRRADMGHQGGAGMAAFPSGFDLADCSPADVMPYLSPSKRFKIAVGADNSAAAVGGGELSMLDVLNLRAAMGGLPAPAEAALAAALRQGNSGSAFAQGGGSLGGRLFLPVGPEIMGQLM